MDPSSLGDVLDCISEVGTATGTERAGTALVDSLRDRLQAVRDTVAGRARPRTFALEWSDPPFNGGHWVPEMIELAGGEAVLASRGTPSVRVSWEQIVSASPEVVVFMPCGYDLERPRPRRTSLLGPRASWRASRRSSPSTPVRTSRVRDLDSSTGWRSWPLLFIPRWCRRAPRVRGATPLGLTTGRR